MSVPPYRLVLHPDPLLRAKAKPVESFDEDLNSLAEAMIRLRQEHEGIGFAAPQAGWSVRMFVCNVDEQQQEEDRVFVNPEILEASGDLEWEEEGCLSLPRVHGNVRRPAFVRMRAFDLEGTPFEVEAEGLEARVWQHEFDHLEGVLILDRMPVLDRLSNRRVLKELETMYVQGGGPANA